MCNYLRSFLKSCGVPRNKMKLFLVMLSLIFTSGCAVFSPQPLSEYNSNYLNAALLERGEVYSVDMGEEKLLISYDVSTINNIWGNSRVDVTTKIFRLIDGKLVQVCLENCSKK